VSVLVKLPFATRPWALPILVALYRPPEGAGEQGARHKTPAHIVRLLLARLMRWFPERHFIFVGDSGYGTSETVRFCQKHRQHLTLVSKFYGDAALYEPAPPRTRHTMGRPCVKGQKLPSPALAGILDRIPTDRYINGIDQMSFPLTDAGESNREMGNCFSNLYNNPKEHWQTGYQGCISAPA
jgi:hypothetical protein